MDEVIYDIIELQQQPTNLIEKTNFKERIPDIIYTPILSGLYIMDPYDGIEEVKEDIRKCFEKIKLKFNENMVINAKLALDYMYNNEPG